MKIILKTFYLGKSVWILDFYTEDADISHKLGRLLLGSEEKDEIISLLQMGASRYMEGEVTVEAINVKAQVKIVPTGYEWMCPACGWWNTTDDAHPVGSIGMGI